MKKIEYSPLKNGLLNRLRQYRLRWAINFLQNEKTILGMVANTLILLAVWLIRILGALELYVIIVDLFSPN